MTNAKDISKIKVVTIDVDGCLVSYKNVGGIFHSSWDAIGFAYGLNETWKKIAEDFNEVSSFLGLK